MIEIFSDLYDVVNRLKEIDNKYRVFYNTAKEKYQLYREQKGRVSYELTFPFNKLDCRAIEHCLKTRRERSAELIKEIEEHNQKLEKEAVYRAKKQAEKRAEEVFRKG